MGSLDFPQEAFCTFALGRFGVAYANGHFLHEPGRHSSRARAVPPLSSA